MKKLKILRKKQNRSKMRQIIQEERVVDGIKKNMKISLKF